jgi:hypothetical protein
MNVSNGTGLVDDSRAEDRGVAPYVASLSMLDRAIAVTRKRMRAAATPSGTLVLCEARPQARIV